MRHVTSILGNLSGLPNVLDLVRFNWEQSTLHALPILTIRGHYAR